jgi:putative ABC transport system ATP-binding protein
MMIKMKGITKIYAHDGVETVALAGVNINVEEGEFLAIMGPSGSGKSTLMHILGALDSPTGGEYWLDNQDVSRLNDDELADIRNRKIGFVFQAYNLLPRTSALKNVELPMAYAEINKDIRVKRAKEMLGLVGLEDRMEHLSNQLSGGQQQRVAIARALTMDPKIILADEPTGNIASQQAEEIMKIFEKLHKDGRTIVMITHEEDIARWASRVVTIRDGKIVEDRKNSRRTK